MGCLCSAAQTSAHIKRAEINPPRVKNKIKFCNTAYQDTYLKSLNFPAQENEWWISITGQRKCCSAETETFIARWAWRKWDFKMWCGETNLREVSKFHLSNQALTSQHGARDYAVSVADGEASKTRTSIPDERGCRRQFRSGSTSVSLCSLLLGGNIHSNHARYIITYHRSVLRLRHAKVALNEWFCNPKKKNILSQHIRLNLTNTVNLHYTWMSDTICGAASRAVRRRRKKKYLDQLYQNSMSKKTQKHSL